MKDIIENNKLIAEFMGWCYGTAYETPFEDAAYCNGEPSHICSDFNLKFHSSWGWLKPVIDKIINTIGVKTIDECSDEEWWQHTRIARMYIGIDIKNAHHYVVGWIKWYNLNKQL